MQKNFKKSADLKLKGVSNDKSQISSVYYFTKPKASFSYSRTASEKEDDSKSICPSDSDFSPIEISDYKKKIESFDCFKWEFWSWSGFFVQWIYAFKKQK